jgi:hypothetical protein
VFVVQFLVMKKVTKLQNQYIQKNTEAPKDVPRLSPPAVKPTAEFTRTLAREIVKNLTALGEFTSRPFHRKDRQNKKIAPMPTYIDPVFVDTSVLIDSRLVMIVASGFFAGTLIVPQFVLAELQHIADSADTLRRTKGRLGLDVVNKLKNQRANERVTVKITAKGTVTDCRFQFGTACTRPGSESS